MEERRQPLIIHHAGCADGFASACVVLSYLGGEADTLALSYNDAPPALDLVRNRDLYIVDFSFKTPELLLEYAAASGSLRWFDHHEASRGVAEAIVGKPGVTTALWDINESGASLVYRALYLPGDPDISLIPFIRDRDLWLWKLHRSREVSAGVEFEFSAYYNVPTKLVDGVPAWRRFVDMDRLSAAENGAILIQSQRNRMERVARETRTLVAADPGGTGSGDGNWYLRVLNATSDLSELADFIAEDTSGPCDGVVMFRQLKDGRWSHSVRSRNGSVFDCNAFAGRFGGGGHKGAAGFTTPQPITSPLFPWSLT